ncbi:hypothetical protein [Kordia jejudonensis]|uniref:hypothetical protein n=1 Tax=Kordia jejudonensis TaxID=1348245 RepID=UPI0006291C84|nr:hypothetical protein [Kordia jejudonensis]
MKIVRFSCFFIFLLNVVMLNAQANDYSFEDAHMKCYEDNFKDKGVALREFVTKAEALLSEANILKGISGESYLYFLKNSGTYTSIDYKNLKFINFVMAQLSAKKFDIKAFKACTETVKQQEGFQNSNMYQVEETLKQIKTANNVQDVTKKVAKLLTPTDLEHIYYRLRIINFLELNGSKSIKPPNENIALSETELRSALKIHIKAQDEIIVHGKAVSFGELLQEVKKYMQKSSTDALIALKVKQGISKQFIQAIKQQISKTIDELQKELSLEKFQRSFNQLTEAEQQEILKVYPKKIVRANF